MAEELNRTFAEAAEQVQRLSRAPSEENMLRLYGLFKQANNGDCEGARPGIMEPVKRAKYDAWKACKGMSQDDAKREYIALVEELSEQDKMDPL